METKRAYLIVVGPINMVEMPGIEPGSTTKSVTLLRV